jgi:hypothetical protein
MGASAFWTTTPATLTVSAEAGEASLTIDGLTGTYNVSDIAPGFTETSAAVPITNDGTVPLNIVVETDGWGTANALHAALNLGVDCTGAFTYSNNGNLLAWDSGVVIGTHQPGETANCSGTLSLPDVGDQNALQGLTAGFTVNAWGKTN